MSPFGENFDKFATPKSEDTAQQSNPLNFDRQEDDPFHGSLQVAVDGKYGGAQLQVFDTSMLQPEMIGSDQYNEVYFETTSGNTYCVYQSDSDGGYYLVDARSNVGRGNKISGYQLTSKDLSNFIISVGSPFMYGTGYHTSSVTSITDVVSRYPVDEASLEKRSQGRTSSIRSDFWSQIMNQPEGK